MLNIKLNNKDVVFGEFPNNELLLAIDQLDIQTNNNITWHYRNNSDMFKLAMLQQYLVSLDKKVTLDILYMPYSRMDRVNHVYSVSLIAMTKFINDLKFDKVLVREAHSAMTTTLLDRCEGYSWINKEFSCLAGDLDVDSIYYPDAGAQLRYEIDPLYSNSTAYGHKVRDFSTGAITSYEVTGYVGKSVLIVDDLCSRGGTFIEAAKQLREKGAQSIYLLVCHCEDNVFTGDIFNWVDRIFTSPEMLTKDHPRITKLS